MLILFSVIAILICGTESWRPGKHISPMPVRNGKIIRTPLRDDYSYKTFYYNQKIDHLGFFVNGTFKQRYLVADQFWNKNGPIFFYTGNEGDIELFANNTGFMWDIAPDFKALIVFAEHRYYGQSLPFGDATFKVLANLNYLTSEQTLADFAELIRFIKLNTPGAASSPVIAFGGSYGGMLAAWFRIKYPNVVIGSLAASAPIWQFPGLTPCNTFFDVTSKTWLAASEVCVANIHQSYQTLDSFAKQGGGLQLISNIFKLCSPLQNGSDVETFKSFLVDMYVDFAMVDYPYPANFLANLPGWPIDVACSYLDQPLQGQPLLMALSQVTNLYLNYSGDTKCINWTGSGSTEALGYNSWDYQTCTEMVMPTCSNNNYMFNNISWNLQEISDACYKKFQVRPNENWITIEYWAKQLKSTSNIIFSNGDLDPWSGGGVLQSISDSLVAIQIPRGAHHLDLRARNPLDTRAVISARIQETNILRTWLGLTPSN